MEVAKQPEDEFPFVGARTGLQCPPTSNKVSSACSSCSDSSRSVSGFLSWLFYELEALM
jgi:hypothetical protein